jgi:hypothetical protein
MRILSHRGYWNEPTEKNALSAFSRSFRLGFGTETDLRDLAGALVISHDPPNQGALPADALFRLYCETGAGLPLALNVKADGLQALLLPLLDVLAAKDCFVFDMSVPDALAWLRTGVPVFTRHSDVEQTPAFYPEATGVWLDAFRDDWWSVSTLRRHRQAGKRVCVVSPELHGRDPRRAWETLNTSDLRGDDQVLLCTDRPEQAREAFGG